MSVKRIRGRKAFHRRLARLILSFIWIRIAAAGRFIARFPVVRRVAGLRVVRFPVKMLVLLWSRLVRPAYLWCKRSVRLTRTFLGRHEVWYWLAGWILCGVLAYSILHMSPSKVAVAVVGAILLAVFLRRIELAIMAVVIMAASFIHHGAIPKPLSLGGMGPNMTELLIMAMIGVVLLRSSRQRKLQLFKSPITVPLLLLYVSVVMSMLESYRLFTTSNDQDLFYLGQIYNNARPMFFYAFFFAVAFGIQTERQLKFVLRMAVWVAAVVGVMIAAQYYLGPHGKSLFVGGTWTPTYTISYSPEEQEVARSMPPGLALICIFFLVTCAQAGYRGAREGLRNALAAVPLGVGLLFSFYRSFWVSTLIGLVIIWLAANAIVKRRLLVYGLTVLVVTIVGTVSFARLVPGTAGEKFSRILTERFMSISKQDTYLVEDSVQNRVRENRMAVQRIKQNPIFGIGSGTPRKYQQWTRPGTYTRVIYPVYYIHNSYLEMWMVYGVLGIVSFAWISIVFLIRCFALFRRVQGASWKAVTIGCFAGYIGFLMRSLTQPHLVHDVFYIVTTALMWGLIEALIRLHSEGRLGGEELPAPSQSGARSQLSRWRRGRVSLPYVPYPRAKNA